MYMAGQRARERNNSHGCTSSETGGGRARQRPRGRRGDRGGGQRRQQFVGPLAAPAGPDADVDHLNDLVVDHDVDHCGGAVDIVVDDLDGAVDDHDDAPNHDHD
jgi:hypothetical protein